MATALNILVEQGTNFKTYITIDDDDGNPIDITGYTFAGTLKRGYQSSNSVAFTCAIEQASNGVMSMALTPAQSEAMKSGRYVYDLIQTDAANKVSRVLEGIATLTPNVTVV